MCLNYNLKLGKERLKLIMKEHNFKSTMITLASIIVAIIVIKIPFQIWNAQIKKSQNVEKNNTLNNIQVEKSQEDINETLIKNFIDYCNNANSESAYSMLTDKCKENMYPTLQDFIVNYYSSKFSTIKNYTITKYNSYIYKIDLKESSINTGKLSENTIQDFIVIQGNKLNINVYNEKDLNIN